jgi:hypothetical protein
MDRTVIGGSLSVVVRRLLVWESMRCFKTRKPLDNPNP